MAAIKPATPMTDAHHREMMAEYPRSEDAVGRYIACLAHARRLERQRARLVAALRDVLGSGEINTDAASYIRASALLSELGEA